MALDQRQMSTAESMAIAVLRGDMDAALQLADLLMETVGNGGVRIPPVTQITEDVDNLRILVFVDPHLVHNGTVEVDRDQLSLTVMDWLRDGMNPLILQGIDRVEFYQMPPGVGPISTRVAPMYDGRPQSLEEQQRIISQITGLRPPPPRQSGFIRRIAESSSDDIPIRFEPGQSFREIDPAEEICGLGHLPQGTLVRRNPDGTWSRYELPEPEVDRINEDQVKRDVDYILEEYPRTPGPSENG